jgi:hypothetical protein
MTVAGLLPERHQGRALVLLSLRVVMMVVVLLAAAAVVVVV